MLTQDLVVEEKRLGEYFASGVKDNLIEGTKMENGRISAVNKSLVCVVIIQGYLRIPFGWVIAESERKIACED